MREAGSIECMLCGYRLRSVVWDVRCQGSCGWRWHWRCDVLKACVCCVLDACGVGIVGKVDTWGTCNLWGVQCCWWVLEKYSEKTKSSLNPETLSADVGETENIKNK